jgi:hypothetical protein
VIEGAIELKDVTQGFAAIGKAATAEKRAFFADIKSEAKKDLRNHQRQARGPDGPWPGPAAATIRRKRRTKRSRPGRLGNIPTAWKSYLDDDSLKFRNMVSFADAHHGGATAGNSARIPARPFAYFSEPFGAAAVEEWGQRVAARWNGK